MLSLCIPIYNKDVRPLVRTLLEQMTRQTYPCELICLDDGSEESVRQTNRCLWDQVTYVEMESNLGRAAIRNRFLQYAKGEYLLFMDCDAEVTEAQFLQYYVNEIQKGREVVCGGHRYLGEVDKDHRLKYRYGSCCEMRSAQQRRQDPNRSFMTGNFMIRKDLLEKSPFDERLKTYGHEDTLMGYRLWQQHHQVWHIDNPIDLRDIDTNEQFLRKTRESVRNLATIYGWMEQPADFARQVRLLSVYNKLKSWHLTECVGLLYPITHSCLEHRFERGYASMSAFRFYKLILLCHTLTHHP